MSCWPPRLPQGLAVACSFAVDPVLGSSLSPPRPPGGNVVLRRLLACFQFRRHFYYITDCFRICVCPLSVAFSQCLSLHLPLSLSLYMSLYLSLYLSVCQSVRLAVFLTRLFCRWLSVVFLQYFVCHCYGCFYHQSILLSHTPLHLLSLLLIPPCVCVFFQLSFTIHSG